MSKDRTSLVLALLAYLALGLALLPFYRYQINPDGIPYLTIAEKYLNGDIGNAINGHFSPMFSWLLIPFLILGVDILLAAKLLSLLIGALTIISVYRLSYSYRMDDMVRKAVLATTVPVVLYFAYYWIEPDLLLTCFLLFYFIRILASDYAEKPNAGLISGVLGGVGYLGKSYFFPFFLVHFPLMNAVHYLRSKTTRNRKIVVRNFTTGLIPFILISSIWIAGISNKYGFFTITTQTIHNMQLMSPKPPGTRFFVPPPNPTAVSCWEDLYSCFPKSTWMPYHSLGGMKIWLRFIVRSIKKTFGIFWDFSPFVFPLCLGALALLLLEPKRLAASKEWVDSLLIMVPFAGGYCMILADERYIWVLCLLMMLLGGHVLSRLFQNPLFSKPVKILVLLVFMASFLPLPVSKLPDQFNSGRSIYRLGRALQAYIPPGSTLAANDDWWQSVFLAFHLKSNVYGTTEKLSAAEAAAELDKHRIEYYVRWMAANYVQPDEAILAKYKEVHRGLYEGAEYIIYKRKPA